MNIHLADFGNVKDDSGFMRLDSCSDGIHIPGKNGVTNVFSTGDGKVELIGYKNRTIAYVNSAMNCPAYYPIMPIEDGKIKAVLMDLDGTTVQSEEFWIYIIQMTTASLLDKPRFELEESDIPYVSGHSVSEHLRYCIDKYCKDKSLEEARDLYFMHTRTQMGLIVEGKGRDNAFTPTDGVKEFLLKMKDRGIKIGLVTSGLYEKAFPEIIAAFRTMKLGDPLDFYDSIITAGYPLTKGRSGTMGELQGKPHPWLYAESFRVGLGLKNRSEVIGIEDSGAGVCSSRLAGIKTIGLSGGNIIVSGTKGMCQHYLESFEEIEQMI